MSPVLIAQESRPRLNQVFQAAQQTAFYRCWLDSLDDSPEHTLDLLPHIDLQHFHEDPEQFHNRKASRRRDAEFHYPLNPAPRIAILTGGFKRTQNVRIAEQFTSESLKALRIGAVAAPVGVLRKMAMEPSAFEYPLVAFTGMRHGYLSREDRELFWRAFGVPVFEQLTALDNDVVAAECEAHEGLHIRSSEAIFEFRGKELVVSSLSNLVHPVLRLATQLTGNIETSLCRCGKPGPRLVALAPLGQASESGMRCYSNV